MMQLHWLSTVLEDQRVAFPTYSYLAPKHYSGKTKASHSEYVALLGTIILHRDKYTTMGLAL